MTAASGDLERGALAPHSLGGAGLTAERGRVRLRTLIAIRWIAALGQASALLVTYFGLGYEYPLPLALAVVGSSVVVNILATVGRRATERLSDRVTAIYLAFDLIQLGALLFLTGGLHNPFALLILAFNINNPKAFTIIISMGIILMYIAYWLLNSQVFRRRREG